MNPFDTIIYSRLGQNGRLGNQLFQFASTYGISQSLLCRYAIPESWVGVQLFNGTFHTYKSETATHSYQEPFFHHHPFNESQMIEISVNQTKVIDISLGAGSSGYYQSEKYWINCKEGVLSMLEFKDAYKKRADDVYKNVKPLIERPFSKNILVAIHFRFGDYVGNSYYANLVNSGYYERAIRRILLENPLWNVNFVVFSDDQIKAKQCMHEFKTNEFPELKFFGLENINDAESLYAMSKCDHFICANSSYSWWGAYLSKNPEKIIIMPEKWFGDHVQLDTKDLYPEGAIIL